MTLRENILNTQLGAWPSLGVPYMSAVVTSWFRNSIRRHLGRGEVWLCRFDEGRQNSAVTRSVLHIQRAAPGESQLRVPASRLAVTAGAGPPATRGVPASALGAPGPEHPFLARPVGLAVHTCHPFRAGTFP